MLRFSRDSCLISMCQAPLLRHVIFLELQPTRLAMLWDSYFYMIVLAIDVYVVFVQRTEKCARQSFSPTKLPLLLAVKYMPCVSTEHIEEQGDSVFLKQWKEEFFFCQGEQCFLRTM